MVRPPPTVNSPADVPGAHAAHAQPRLHDCLNVSHLQSRGRRLAWPRRHSGMSFCNPESNHELSHIDPRRRRAGRLRGRRGVPQGRLDGDEPGAAGRGRPRAQGHRGSRGACTRPCGGGRGGARRRRGPACAQSALYGLVAAHAAARLFGHHGGGDGGRDAPLPRQSLQLRLAAAAGDRRDDADAADIAQGAVARWRSRSAWRKRPSAARA